MIHAFTMMTARGQPERYGWWTNELESLGLSIKKTNEFNDLKEISNLVEILKQDNYLDYLSFLRRLIILRGPMGSGKSSVSTSIMELLGRDCACILDLDMTHPYENKFNQNLKKCLTYKTVIGMMFYGDSHTTAPAHWLGEFRNHDYRILSVILGASKQLCFVRCKEDPGRHSFNKQMDTVYKCHDDFYRRECEGPFHKTANLEERTIDTANTSPTKTAKNILKCFSGEMTRSMPLNHQ